MQSPVKNLKRSFSDIVSPTMLSPQFQQSISIYRNEITKKKLIFSLSDSPCVSRPTPVFNIDENSCDSGFSEASNSNTFQSLDESITDDYTTFEDCCDSPLTQLNTLQNTMSSINTVNMNPFNERLKKKQKSDKFNDDVIKQALEKIENESSANTRLIGDMSGIHTLPIMTSSKHKDLASITPSTLAAVINGHYKEKLSDYIIFDARYPYEFEGGHIANAESAYAKEKIFNKLFNSPMTTKNGKPMVLIFHCEFSSERGPKLMREIRERDRMLNKHCYPSLNYPEIYLLEGGYKSFYEGHDNLCEPNGYMPMHHNNHRQDLKFFRSKSKSLDAEIKKKLTKSRSMRLMF